MRPAAEAPSCRPLHHALLFILAIIGLAQCVSFVNAVAPNGPLHTVGLNEEEHDTLASGSLHPHLRRARDHTSGSGADLHGTKENTEEFNFFQFMDGKEREVLVPPAAQETTRGTTTPVCPKNARFAFCAVDPKCALTCSNHIEHSKGGTPAGVVKMCNKMCYQRCECLPDFYLLEGFCVPEDDCLSIKEATSPAKKRQAIEVALAGFDPITDRLTPLEDEEKGKKEGGKPPFSIPRFPPLGRSGGGGTEEGGDDIIDDVNEVLGTVTGGLWPGGEQGKDKRRKEEGEEDEEEEEEEEENEGRLGGSIHVGRTTVSVNIAANEGLEFVEDEQALGEAGR